MRQRTVYEIDRNLRLLISLIQVTRSNKEIKKLHKRVDEILDERNRVVYGTDDDSAANVVELIEAYSSRR